MQLLASGMPPTALCLMVWRNATAPATSFGDGLTCTDGLALRLGVRTASSGMAQWPMLGEPALTVESQTLGYRIVPGSARYYCLYYRDPAPGFACSATFNTTQSLRARY